MIMIKAVGLAAMALIAGVLVETGRARADETFVCDGGRLVRAKPADLEHLKRTDACVAGYFGTTLQPSGQASGERDAIATDPLPTTIRDVSLDPASTVGRVVEQPAQPKLPSDARNVLILNREPGASPYFILRR
jgi:hypothetical protein